jgi:WD40 repeat protein
MLPTRSCLIWFLCLALLVSPPARGEEPRAKAARTDSNGDPLPPGALARVGSVRFRHSAFICTAVFSPDGKLIASGGHDKVLRLWEAKTGKPIRTLSGTEGRAILSIAFSPDGKTLVSGSWDDVIRIWDVASGMEVRQLGAAPGAHGWVGVAYSPDGKTLASTSGAKIRFWDTATWRELQPLEVSSARVQALAYSQDGKSLLVGDSSGQLRLWDLATRKAVVSCVGLSNVHCAAISRDGSLLAGGDQNGTLLLWNAATGKEVQCLHRAVPLRNGARSVQFSPTGTTVASCGWNDVVQVWDVRTGKLLHQFGKGEAEFGDVAFSPDGKRLACAADRAVRVWDLETRTEVVPLGSLFRAVDATAFSPDGKLVALGSGSGVHLHHAATLKEIRRFSGEQGARHRLTFSSDGKKLASEDWSGILCFWETGSGKLIWQWGESSDSDQPVVKHSAVPGLRAFVSWGYPGHDLRTGRIHEENLDVRVREADIGKELLRFPRAAGFNQKPTFSPEGDFLALVCEQGSKVCIHDLGSGKEIVAFPAESGAIRQTVFSPDGRALLTITEGGSLRVWELATCRERARIELGTASRGGCVCSPDGRLLACCTAEGPIILRNLATGAELTRFVGHYSGVNQVAFSPDGDRLASAGEDAVVLLWDVAAIRKQALPKTDRLASEQLERCWAELASGNAMIAWRAIRKLEGAAGEVVPHAGIRSQGTGALAFMRIPARTIPQTNTVVGTTTPGNPFGLCLGALIPGRVADTGVSPPDFPVP